tara:strand:- start:1166 stop:1885 length:720 start_codon:yes stop_codon:yes gene_type:complete
MVVLVVGASGATGRQLVAQLLKQGHDVKVVVRSAAKIPVSWERSEGVKISLASLLDLSDAELMELTLDCNAIASCLGHTISWKGIYGHPRMLVTEATRRLCTAIDAHKPESPVKFVLMNTTGNRNRDINEPILFAQKCVIGLLRLLLPPHVDNEKAADYLRTQIGQHNPFIEWAAVRPDSLLDAEAVTNYEVYPSPIRSAIFNSGKTSRINVGHFMAQLIEDGNLWKEWKGKMPVVYNK